MKKLMIAVAAIAAGSFTFAETAINRAPGQEDAFNAGEAVTNASGTVQFRKFGKVKAKDEVAVNVTDIVIAKGNNTWTDEDEKGEEIVPKDGVWGFTATYTVPSGVSAFLSFTSSGIEYLSKTGSAAGENCTYFAETRKGAMSNAPWQWGTNIAEAATSPKLVLPKDAVGAGVNQIKQNDCQKFVSLADVIKIVEASKNGKLTVNLDGTFTIAE